jgi:hypothetical protein
LWVNPGRQKLVGEKLRGGSGLQVDGEADLLHDVVAREGHADRVHPT